MNQREVTQTKFTTRLWASSIVAMLSSGVVWTTQAILWQWYNQVFISAWVELWTTFITSLVNQSIYNVLKKQIQEVKKELDTTYIELISATIVSIFGVGAPRLLWHLRANTENALEIAVIYSILGVVFLMLYEKKILQRNNTK